MALKRKRVVLKPAPCTVDGLTDRLRRIYHEPKPGRPVRLLDPEGEEVDLDPWWKRRLKAGDVVEVQAPAGGASSRRRRSSTRTVETFDQDKDQA